MGCKQGARLVPIVQMFDDGPSQAQSIVGARPAPDLVEDHQRSLGSGIEDSSRLDHLDHESALAASQLVACPNPRKELVGNPDRGFSSRHKTADLSEHHDGGTLPDVGALTGHVRAGDELNAAVLRTDHAVVGHKLALGHHAIEHRMATFVDLQNRFLGHRRADIVVFYGQLSKRR